MNSCPLIHRTDTDQKMEACWLVFVQLRPSLLGVRSYKGHEGILGLQFRYQETFASGNRMTICTALPHFLSRKS